MARLIIPILLTIFLPMALLPMDLRAEQPGLRCENSLIARSEAESLLSKVQSRYEKIDSLTAQFRQESYLAALEASETSSGTVLFKRPGQMKWHYSAPDEQVFLVSDDAFWLYQIEDQQVLIDDADQVLLSDLPVAFLMGIGNLSQDFRVETACRRSDGILFELKPADQQQIRAGLGGLSLLVSDESYLPSGAEVEDISGNRTTIRLLNIKPTAGLSGKEFALKIPRGTDVNDRRAGKQG